jgi:hypothetical protein
VANTEAKKVELVIKLKEKATQDKNIFKVYQSQVHKDIPLDMSPPNDQLKVNSMSNKSHDRSHDRSQKQEMHSNLIGAEP